MVRIFFTIISFIGLINAQEISSSVSTKNISITESIIFTIKISNVDENPSVDISKIEDSFSIISGPNIGSEYRFVNGDRSSSRSISWTLIAKEHGILEIPSLKVNIGQKMLITNLTKFKFLNKLLIKLLKIFFLKLK